MSSQENSIIPLNQMFESNSQLTEELRDQTSKLDFSSSEFSNNSINNQWKLIYQQEQLSSNQTLVLSQEGKEKVIVGNSTLDQVLDKINQQQDGISAQHLQNTNNYNELMKNPHFQKGISFEVPQKENTLLKQFQSASDVQLHQSMCHNYFTKQCLGKEQNMQPNQIDNNLEQDDLTKQIKGEAKQATKAQLKTIAQIKAQQIHQSKTIAEKTIKKGLLLVEDKTNSKKQLTEKMKKLLKINLKLSALKQTHCNQKPIKSDNSLQLQAKLSDQICKENVQKNIQMFDQMEQKIEDQDKLYLKKSLPNEANNKISKQAMVASQQLNLEVKPPILEKPRQLNSFEMKQLSDQKPIDISKRAIDQQIDDSLISNRKQQSQKNYARSKHIQYKTPLVGRFHQEPLSTKQLAKLIAEVKQETFQNQAINLQEKIVKKEHSEKSVSSLIDKYRHKRDNSTYNYLPRSNDYQIQENSNKFIIAQDNTAVKITETNEVSCISQENQSQPVINPTENKPQYNRNTILPYKVLATKTLNYQQQNVSLINTSEKQKQNLEAQTITQKIQTNPQEDQLSQNACTNVNSNCTTKNLNYYRNKYAKNVSIEREQKQQSQSQQSSTLKNGIVSQCLSTHQERELLQNNQRLNQQLVFILQNYNLVMSFNQNLIKISQQIPMLKVRSILVLLLRYILMLLINAQPPMYTQKSTHLYN